VNWLKVLPFFLGADKLLLCLDDCDLVYEESGFKRFLDDFLRMISGMLHFFYLTVDFLDNNISFLSDLLLVGRAFTECVLCYRSMCIQTSA